MGYGMSLQLLTSLYGPAKDVATGAATLFPPRLKITINAHPQNQRTWIVVTAQCRKGDRQVTVLQCHAELYAYTHSCAGFQAVRCNSIRLLPTRHVNLWPGEAPHRWEAFVLNEHLRRESVKRDFEATSHALGGSHFAEMAIEDRKRWLLRHPNLHSYVTLLSPTPSVSVRVILETSYGSYASKATEVPGPLPFDERIELAINQFLGQWKKPGASRT
jgi:hypothetical protein